MSSDVNASHATRRRPSTSIPRVTVAAGDDDGPDAVVVVEAADRAAELVEERRAAGVQLVGPVERDDRVPLVGVLLDEQRLEVGAFDPSALSLLVHGHGLSFRK